MCEVILNHSSHVWLCPSPWSVAPQAPLIKRFSRQEYWSGLPFPPPGDLPDPGMVPASVSCIGRWALHHQHHLGSPLSYRRGDLMTNMRIQNHAWQTAGAQQSFRRKHQPAKCRAERCRERWSPASSLWASCLAALLRSVSSMPSPLGCISGLVLKFKFPGATYNSAHTASCFHVKMQSKRLHL